MPSQEALRMTPQRRVILEELGKTSSHPTADWIYRKVRRRLPRISLGTVYRNLDILSKHGMIRTLERAGTQKRYDGNVREHYHVRCVQCGRIADLPVEPLKPIKRVLNLKVPNFILTDLHLELFGLCSECRRRRRDRASERGKKGGK